MTRKIELTQGRFAVVDDDDYESVIAHRWHAVKRGRIFYAATNLVENGRRQYTLLHRFISKPLCGVQVDHVDGDGLNNTKKNLRHATAQQNSRNKAPRGESGYSGVRQIRGLWAAFISAGDSEIFLGRFSDEEAAAATYNEAGRVVYKEFARLNRVPFDRSGFDRAIASKQASVDRLLWEIRILEGK